MRRSLGDLTALDRPAPVDRVASSLLRDTVGQISLRPVTMPLGASVAQAVRTLLDEEVGAVLIVNDAGLLAGIFSERDLLTKVAGAEKPMEQMRIEEYMTPKPQSVGPEDKLALALHQMDVGGYRHLPVVRDGKPIAMHSVRDLMRHMTRMCKG